MALDQKQLAAKIFSFVFFAAGLTLIILSFTHFEQQVPRYQDASHYVRQPEMVSYTLGLFLVIMGVSTHLMYNKESR